MRLKTILIIPIILILVSPAYCGDKTSSGSAYSTIGTSEKSNATPFPDNDATQKIIKRTNLEQEGDCFAKQGLYKEALVKYRAALDPSLLNYEHEKSTAKWAIEEIYMRQRKFEEALKIVDENLILRPQNDELIRRRLELLAFIKARDTKNNKPIYDYLDYIKSKYANYLPPKGYLSGISGWLISDVIHLYDYMRDYDAGVAFMDEIIKYHTQHSDKNHRSAHTKDVVEYTRVKQAWELDKKTGKHGHLQEVIKTSDIISW